MKFTKRKGDMSSLRKAMNDERTVCYGVVGTVGDLLAENILESCDCSPDVWLFLAVDEKTKDGFGESRDEAVAGIKEG